MTTRSRGRVCFYAPYLYPVTASGEVEFVGGTEVRQWLLARALSARGFDVTIATCDYGQGPVVERDGVTLLATFAPYAGVPGVRFFYPRLWKAMRTLSRARADVYVSAGAGIGSGWAYDAARLRRAPFVFLAAHDDDARPALPWLPRRRERWWYRRALRGADLRIAQTKSQRQLFRDNFGVDAAVVPNPVELPRTPVDAGANDTVLWLSTFRTSKRPEWFVELARRLPDVRFRMVGLPHSADLWDAARHAAAELPNLEVDGFVSRDEAADLLRAAGVVALTSEGEGFPMVLLEAWSLAVPTVSTVDPGGVVTRYGLGETGMTVDQLAHAVGTLMASPDRRRSSGARARQYVEEHHGAARTYDRLAALLDELIGGRAS